VLGRASGSGQEGLRMLFRAEDRSLANLFFHSGGCQDHLHEPILRVTRNGEVKIKSN